MMVCIGMSEQDAALGHVTSVTWTQQGDIVAALGSGDLIVLDSRMVSRVVTPFVPFCPLLTSAITA